MPLPVGDRGYQHPELLAETDWLASHLSDATLRIVDARADQDYAAGHIPGAINLSGFSLGQIGPESEPPDLEGLAARAGALGIDEGTPVVVYDSGGPSQLAGMTGWALLYYGHPELRYLDGGLAKWTAEGLPLSTDATTHEQRTFTPRHVEGVFCSLDQAKAAIGDDDVVFWDVRSVGEFDGTTKGWNPSASARAPARGGPVGLLGAVRCRRRHVEARWRAHDPARSEGDYAGVRSGDLLRRRCARGSRGARPESPGVRPGIELRRIVQRVVSAAGHQGGALTNTSAAACGLDTGA